jgi:AcrR family transcriptional regulator
MQNDESDSDAPVKKRGPGRPRHETPSADYLQRRDEIIDAATAVFQVKGYEAGSLDDVAEALDLRKGSLYYYIRSKAELLYFIFDRAISKALHRIEMLSLPDASPQERLEALIRHQVETIADDLSMFSVFFDQRPHLTADHEMAIRAKERQYLESFMSIVDAAVADGLLGKVDRRYAAQVILGATTWTYKWFHPERDDPKMLADTVVILLLGPPDQHLDTA